MSLDPGTRFGAYEVVEMLGAGGMGEVYRAHDSKLGRDVAIKILPAHLTSEPERGARFAREARVLASLNHPNIGAIYGLEEADCVTGLVLEVIDGHTLAQRLERGSLPLAEALSVARQLASALAAAHAAGVVHRDLKPDNVMIRPDGLVKIVDFGVAKLAPVAAPSEAALTVAATQQGLLLGTLNYMSPEQARGYDVDVRTDIWSLGAMLYEMITGRHPFAAESVSDVLAAILTSEPAPLAQFQADVPGELERVVSKTLRKDREHRYRSMQDLMLDLEALSTCSPVSGSVAMDAPLSPVETPAPSPPSLAALPTRIAVSRGQVSLAALAVLLAVGAAWWSITRTREVAPDTPSVVVLPFKTIGSGDEYLADGITEALTTELGRFGDLKVIASNTAFTYRDNTGFREIGRRLGVRLVVRGSVQRVAGHVRIDTSLIDTRDETVLWSDHYGPDDVLKVQDRIAQQIASTVSRKFGRMSSASHPSRATRNAAAYDAYLRGVWHLKNCNRGMQEGQQVESRRLAAIAELEQAVAHDPEFALAHAALASAYTQRFFYDTGDDTTEQKAFVEVHTALRLDPNLGEAYLARAQLRWTLRNRFPHKEAIADLRSALKLNPNLAEGYVELGKVYYHIGLTDLAVDANNQAERLDPSDPTPGNRRVRALVDAGRLEEARRDLERTVRPAAFVQAEVLVAMGRFTDALALISGSSIKGSDPENESGLGALLGLVYARLNRPNDARRLLAEWLPVADNPAGLSHMHHAQYLHRRHARPPRRTPAGHALAASGSRRRLSFVPAILGRREPVVSERCRRFRIAASPATAAARSMEVPAVNAEGGLNHERTSAALLEKFADTAREHYGPLLIEARIWALKAELEPIAIKRVLSDTRSLLSPADTISSITTWLQRIRN